MFWARHTREFAIRVLILVLLACVAGMFAWLPISTVILRVQVRQVVKLEQQHFLTEGRFVYPTELPGALKVPGTVLDSAAFRPGGFYLRIAHRLSPKECWYDSAMKEEVRCR